MKTQFLVHLSVTAPFFTNGLSFPMNLTLGNSSPKWNSTFATTRRAVFQLPGHLEAIRQYQLHLWLPVRIRTHDPLVNDKKEAFVLLWSLSERISPILKACCSKASLEFATALALFALIWLIVRLSTRRQPVVFDPEGKHGEFGKTLLPMYLDIAKFVLGLAAGSIVLLVGSLNITQSHTRPLSSFTSPLFLVAMSIIYGVLFMILLVFNYEHHLHLQLRASPASSQ